MFDDVPFKIFMFSLIIKLINKLIVKRNYFVQKIIHFFHKFSFKIVFSRFYHRRYTIY